jgi:ferredoxin-NADP reductase/MOSC domain-containing protein YiiM
MMKILSINVGLPQEIEWKGQKVRTSIFKKPITGRVRVRHLNIDGDGQADLIGHGGEHRAVMVYQAESYAYWQEILQRNDLYYGRFGENLTVEGLADKDVCIGDRYRIGTAVFEVTQPRVTCFKVGISLGLPEMPALLVSHKRPGFYFRVIAEGEIEAGDPIEKIANGTEGMTVADIDQLLYSKDHPKQQLQKALKISALAKGWQSSFTELLAAVESGITSGNPGLAGAQAKPLAWTGYRCLRISRIRMESASIRSFEFQSEDGTPLPAFQPGQHLAIRVPIDPASQPLIRMYSLSGAPDGPNWRIAVKKESDGRGSGYLHDHVRVGDLLEISAPRGTFILSADTRPVILLSAGVGITPMLAMLFSIKQASPNRPTWWIYSAHNDENHPFVDEVRTLAADLKSFHSLILHSRPGNTEQQGRDFDTQGRLTLDVLQRLNLPVDAECYLCGPGPYLEETTHSLKLLGIAEKQIHFETFGGPVTNSNGKAPHLPADNTGDGPLVTFTKSNLEFCWNQKFSSLLEATEAADVPVRWSCRTGVCHLCESALLDGAVTYSPSPLDPPAEGNLLLCCSRPSGPVSLDL